MATSLERKINWEDCMLKQLCATLFMLFTYSVLAQTPDPALAQKVTGEELRKLISGATLRGDNGKFIFRHTYKKDGTLDGGSSYSGGDGNRHMNSDPRQRRFASLRVAVSGALCGTLCGLWS